MSAAEYNAIVATLEKRVEELDRAWNKAQDRNARLEEVLTTKRTRIEKLEAECNRWDVLAQKMDARRKEAEAVLRVLERIAGYSDGAGARAYFARYPEKEQ